MATESTTPSGDGQRIGDVIGVLVLLYAVPVLFGAVIEFASRDMYPTPWERGGEAVVVDYGQPEK